MSARRRVASLAWPLILSNITVPMLGLVDTAVMGHLPDARYLGGVTLGAVLFSFLFWAFGFLRMGTTGLTAQAHGRADEQAVFRLLLQSLVLAVGIGAVLAALHPMLIPVGLTLLGGSAAVTEQADIYARIRILSAPAVLANYVLIGWFLGRGVSRVTLLLMLVNNLVNIVLDLVFVLVLGMATAGVAAASVIADYLTTALGISLALGVWRHAGWVKVPGVLADIAGYRRLFSVNSALFVRTLCLLFAFAFFHSQGARLGDVSLAGNAVLLQFVLLASYGLDGFAHAIESLVGRAVGAGDGTDYWRVIRAGFEWSVMTALLMSAGFWLFGEGLIALLTDLPEVRLQAAEFLLWMMVMPIVAAFAYLLDGIFIGATRTRAMRDTMLIAVALIYLPAWWLTQPWGNHGLWFAFILFNAARGILLGGLFIRDWQRRSLQANGHSAPPFQP